VSGSKNADAAKTRLPEMSPHLLAGFQLPVVLIVFSDVDQDFALELGDANATHGRQLGGKRGLLGAWIPHGIEA